MAKANTAVATCTGNNCVHVIKSSTKHVDFENLSLFESVSIALIAFMAVTAGVVYSTVITI